jgi:hypothetical protein
MVSGLLQVSRHGIRFVTGLVGMVSGLLQVIWHGIRFVTG